MSWQDLSYTGSQAPVAVVTLWFTPWGCFHQLGKFCVFMVLKTVDIPAWVWKLLYSSLENKKLFSCPTGPWRQCHGKTSFCIARVCQWRDLSGHFTDMSGLWQPCECLDAWETGSHRRREGWLFFLCDLSPPGSGHGASPVPFTVRIVSVFCGQHARVLF